MEELTRFSHFDSAPAYRSDPNDANSPYAGKVTLPSGAPDNHLLLVYSPGPSYGIAGKEDDAMHRFRAPAIDSGIYLLKSGKPIDEPGKLLLIKNDPKYNEQWPRALVPYKRIYGGDEPVKLAHYNNDGRLSRHPPEGTPYGLVGSASLYKRESYPGGSIYKNEVTAWAPESDDPFRNLGTLDFTGFGGNWFDQGAETSKYDNKEIHAIRILVTEPTTDPALTGLSQRRWWNASNERLRILGEIPVRKFQGGKQPLDPDGNPDTSFLVKIPADMPWTFQTLDKDGMVPALASDSNDRARDDLWDAAAGLRNRVGRADAAAARDRSDWGRNGLNDPLPADHAGAVLQAARARAVSGRRSRSILDAHQK